MECSRISYIWKHTVCTQYLATFTEHKASKIPAYSEFISISYYNLFIHSPIDGYSVSSWELLFFFCKASMNFRIHFLFVCLDMLQFILELGHRVGIYLTL